MSQATMPAACLPVCSKTITIVLRYEKEQIMREMLTLEAFEEASEIVKKVVVKVHI